MPSAGEKKTELYLTRNEIFTDDFEETITDAEGMKRINDTDRGHLYHGIINEAGKISLACISIFENELAGVICDESGNWNLGRLKGRDSDVVISNDDGAKITGNPSNLGFLQKGRVLFVLD